LKTYWKKSVVLNVNNLIISIIVVSSFSQTAESRATVKTKKADTTDTGNTIEKDFLREVSWQRFITKRRRGGWWQWELYYLLLHRRGGLSLSSCDYYRHPLQLYFSALLCCLYLLAVYMRNSVFVLVPIEANKTLVLLFSNVPTATALKPLTCLLCEKT